ncbi:MAG: HdeD family acid-resistance protein, partial [Bryobacteraceae bacterium]
MIELETLRRNWGWILLFGCLSVALGIAAILDSLIFTLVSVMFIAWVLIVGGIIEGVHAIRHRETSQLILCVIEAILAIVVGALLLRGPVGGALIVTLLLAAYFIVAGALRITAAIALRLPNWGWTLFDGLVTLALGIVVWGGWPATALWV